MPKPKRTPPLITSLGYDSGKPFISGVELIQGTQYTITATVNVKTQSVKWIRDGSVVKTDSAAPFDYTWTPTSLGAHTFVVTPYAATDATGTAGPPVTINWTLKEAAPVPPTTVSALVSWTQIADATGYRVSWGTASRQYSYVQDVGNKTSCVVTGLIPGTSYYFGAKSYNATQTSDWSNEVRYIPI